MRAHNTEYNTDATKAALCTGKGESHGEKREDNDKEYLRGACLNLALMISASVGIGRT